MWLLKWLTGLFGGRVNRNAQDSRAAEEQAIEDDEDEDDEDDEAPEGF